MISTFDKPRGMHIDRSPKLAVLVDLGSSHGLLLTMLVFQSYFHIEGIPGYAYGKVAKTCIFIDSGLFHVLLLAVFGTWSDFHFEGVHIMEGRQKS